MGDVLSIILHGFPLRREICLGKWVQRQGLNLHVQLVKGASECESLVFLFGHWYPIHSITLKIVLTVTHHLFVVGLGSPQKYLASCPRLDALGLESRLLPAF